MRFPCRQHIFNIRIYNSDSFKFWQLKNFMKVDLYRYQIDNSFRSLILPIPKYTDIFSTSRTSKSLHKICFYSVEITEHFNDTCIMKYFMWVNYNMKPYEKNKKIRKIYCSVFNLIPKNIFGIIVLSAFPIETNLNIVTFH